MADNSPQAHSAAPVGSGHENDEVGIRGIFIFAGGLVVMITAVLAVAAGLMGYFKGEESKLAADRPALYNDQSGQFPPPRLQRNDTYDMNRLREEEAATLSSYGWVDRDSGVARIPIDRALSILVERGLPTPKTPRPAPDTAGPKPR